MRAKKKSFTSVGMTPTFCIKFIRVLNSIVDDFQSQKHFSDTAISKAIFQHANGLKALRSFQGAGHAPNLSKLLEIEIFLRNNWHEDGAESERLYQESLRRALVNQGVGNDIDNP